MTAALDDLPEQALSLAPADRARLASGRLSSLDELQDDAADAERLWSEQTERRMAMLESGEAQAITWDQMVDRIDSLRPSASATE